MYWKISSDEHDRISSQVICADFVLKNKFLIKFNQFYWNDILSSVKVMDTKACLLNTRKFLFTFNP
jgi:hypothetical protein